MSSQEKQRVKPNSKLSQILEMPLAFGDLYWLKEKSEGKVQISYAGDLLNKELLNKFNDHHHFYLERVVKMEAFLSLKSKLASFKVSTTERSRIEVLVNFLCQVKVYYYDDNAEESILSLSAACFDIFQYEECDFYSKLYELNTKLFRRSIRMASLGAVFAMAAGYTDFSLIRDFYNVCFYGVYGFFSENNLVATTDALEQERSASGSISEKINMENNKSTNALTEDFEKFITNKTIKDFSQNIFEKLDGKGKPFCLSEDEVSDLEAIFLFLNSATTFRDFEFKEQDGTKYIRAMLTTERALAGNYRIKKILAGRFEGLKAIEKSYLELMA